jgi:hypothetical protein
MDEGRGMRGQMRNLFRLARVVAGKRPKLLITDGLPAYHQAYMKEYEINSVAMTTHHIRKIALTGERNNNKMERLNGEIRDREKVMRGLKREDTPILKMRHWHLDHTFDPKSVLKHLALPINR